MEDRSSHDRHLHTHQQRARGYSVLPTGMAVPVGSDQRGGDFVVLFGHGHDCTDVDQLSTRISNSFRQHNCVPQLVHVATQFTKVIRARGTPKDTIIVFITVHLTSENE